MLAALVVVATIVSVVGADARLLADQPFPDAAEYADGARNIAAGEGYVTTVNGGGEQPPRYPPGFSLALVPFAELGEFPGSVQRGARAYAVLYVLAIALAAWHLGGPLAAALATLVVGLSPFARTFGGLVLSDALVAALTVLVLPLLRPVTHSGARLAGLLTGIGTLVRLTGITTLAAMLVALPRRAAAHALAWAIPGIAAIFAFQWLVFGNPLTTGYDYWRVADGLFSPAHVVERGLPGDGPFIVADVLDGALLSWTCPCPAGGPQAALPNLVLYPAALLGLLWVYAPPLFTLPGLLWAWRRRRSPEGRFALALTATTLGLMSLYFYQGVRFVAAPASVLLVLSSVAVTGWITAFATRATARVARPAPVTGGP